MWVAYVVRRLVNNIKQLLIPKVIIMIIQPCDCFIRFLWGLFLFSKLKNMLKSHHFGALTGILKTMPVEASQRCYQDW